MNVKVFNPDGSYYIEDVPGFIPEPDTEPETDDTSVWDELDAAYQKGVDSV